MTERTFGRPRRHLAMLFVSGGLWFRLVQCFAAAWGGAVFRASADGGEVAVVYSRQIPESKEVASHYAKLRQVPANQIIEIDVPFGESISRADYARKIEGPILQALDERHLLSLKTILKPATPTEPGGFRHTCTGGKIRYLVMTWGLPYRILPDPKLHEPTNGIPPVLQRNEACVDNELALLPASGSFTLTGPLYNRVSFAATNPAVLNPANQLLMVTRLDGPTPAIARRLVDTAVNVEKTGLWGHAYFDLRSIGGDYKLGDTFMTNGAIAAGMAGLETFVDTAPEVFPSSYPLSHVAIYAGWYSWDIDGPFQRPNPEFMPGAIAYHLHSFSAAQLRSTNKNWVGPFLSRGVAATLGCTDEPYLSFTPDVGIFLSRVLAGWTWGEATYASMRALSWQTIVVGDPLYRPYNKSPEAQLAELEKSNDPKLDWAVLRATNLGLRAGRDPQKIRAFLESLAITRRSPVLQEKLASLALAAGAKEDAIRHYEIALELPVSDMQRMRILLALAALQADVGRPQQAYLTYERALTECREWIDAAGVRQKQHALPKHTGRPADPAAPDPGRPRK